MVVITALQVKGTFDLDCSLTWKSSSCICFHWRYLLINWEYGGWVKRCFIEVKNKANGQKKKKATQLWIINRPAHSKWSNELKLISCYFLGGTEYFDNFIHSAALEQMAAKQMLWEGRSSPTTSGTSACTGSTFFSGYSYWIFKEG